MSPAIAAGDDATVYRHPRCEDVMARIGGRGAILARVIGVSRNTDGGAHRVGFVALVGGAVVEVASTSRRFTDAYLTALACLGHLRALDRGRADA